MKEDGDMFRKPEPPELDHNAFELLTCELLFVIKSHYTAQGGTPPARVFEALNALACATAVVISGARLIGTERLAIEFFNKALSSQLASPIGETIQ